MILKKPSEHAAGSHDAGEYLGPFGSHYFFRSMNSGKNKTVTDIMKARFVPTAKPFSIRVLINDITPVALE